MVCAPSHTAADFIAERLYQVPELSDKIIRFYSDRRENIFSLSNETLNPYHMISKILHLTPKKQADYILAEGEVDERQLQILEIAEKLFGGNAKRLRKILSHQETAEDVEITEDSFIDIAVFKDFKIFEGLQCTVEDFTMIRELAVNFEFSNCGGKIRRNRFPSENVSEKLGIDLMDIKPLNKQQLDHFLRERETWETRIL